MITAERKPLEEITEFVKPHGRILLVGCNENALPGGRKEVGLLHLPRLKFMQGGQTLDIEEMTLERQYEC